MRIILFVILSCFCLACQSPADTDDLPLVDSKLIGRTTNAMTDVMVHDVTNPPLAARFFAYALLAGYETMAMHDSNYPSMAGRVNDFKGIEKPEIKAVYSYQLAALYAVLETAKRMQPSGATLESQEEVIRGWAKDNKIAEKVVKASQEFGAMIAKQIIQFAATDGYKQISNLPRYEPIMGDGYWYPTPPGYFPPVEPHFSTVRPFTLDSSSQFKPAPPIAFSSNKNSAFFKMLQANHDVQVIGEKAEIAAFWDCNPFALEPKGHLHVGMKKISPGSHWMGITEIVCNQANFDFNYTMYVHLVVAATMLDGFIACWDEKFRSNRIRPETAIRKYIDPHWTPFLQTPPFPEYLSGHSVVSAAIAEVLTVLVGDNFQYTDTVEERFGLKARVFSSFRAAAQESGLSRFYGGIHFMDAIEQGQEQGIKVGHWSIMRLAIHKVK